MRPGIYSNISNDEYHAGEGVSKSKLDLISQCPAKFEWEIILGNKPAPSAAMLFGAAFHPAILEPDLYRKNYCVAPECDKRTKAGKELWAEFCAANAGKTVLSAADGELIAAMAEAVRKHPAAAALLNTGRAEQSAYWIDRATEELCKCRPDWVHDGSGLVVDLKSCEDASPAGFAKSVANFRYHVQAAFYLDGLSAVAGERLDQFILIAVEKKPPHLVGVYLVEQEAVDKGRELYRRDLDTYAACKASGIWPGYGDQIQEILLPRWAA